jgi:hypothetical protein
MLRAMLDPEGQPGASPPPDDDAQGVPPNSWPAVQYWAAIGQQPAATGTPGPPGAPIEASAASAAALPALALREYELPTARKAVSTGLQLSLASTRDLRRASIYIGLLSLGAFGPVLISILLTLGRLGDEAVFLAGMYFTDPEFLFTSRPEVGVAISIALILGLCGLLLFFAISIDGQVIAIAILGGRASEKPLRLWEAIRRARQSFWRIAGVGFLVGIISSVVQLLLVIALGGFSRSDEALSFVTAVLATLILAPFAYVSTAIVLGDVDAIEALSRSWRLFRARPVLALVVVMFTLVTEGIQLFALGAGLDLIIRAGELTHVSLTEGAFAFAVAVVLILASLVAIGSLVFTIAAIVAAPQVAGFLGLTFYSGGLDKARVDEARPPAGFRWVTRPMLISMVLLGVAAVLATPTITATSYADDPLFAILESAANERDVEFYVVGASVLVEDPTDDQVGSKAPGADVTLAEYAVLDTVPPWILDEVFKCGAPNVSCTNGAGSDEFELGALLFFQRMAAPPDVSAGVLSKFGPVFALDGELTAPRIKGDHFGAASDAVMTELSGSSWQVTPLSFARSSSLGSSFDENRDHPRSAWLAADLLTLVPISEVSTWPFGWDAYASVSGPDGSEASRDTIREIDGGSLADFPEAPVVFMGPFPSFEP